MTPIEHKLLFSSEKPQENQSVNETLKSQSTKTDQKVNQSVFHYLWKGGIESIGRQALRLLHFFKLIPSSKATNESPTANLKADQVSQSVNEKATETLLHVSQNTEAEESVQQQLAESEFVIPENVRQVLEALDQRNEETIVGHPSVHIQSAEQDHGVEDGLNWEEIHLSDNDSKEQIADSEEENDSTDGSESHQSLEDLQNSDFNIMTASALDEFVEVERAGKKEGEGLSLDEQKWLKEAIVECNKAVAMAKKNAPKGNIKHASQINFPKNFKGKTDSNPISKNIQADLVKGHDIMDSTNLEFTKHQSFEDLPSQFAKDLFRSRVIINGQELYYNFLSIELNKKDPQLHDLYRSNAYQQLQDFKGKLTEENPQSGNQIFKNIWGLTNQFAESPGVQYVLNLMPKVEDLPEDRNPPQGSRGYSSYNVEDLGATVRIKIKTIVSLKDGGGSTREYDKLANTLVGYVAYCREMEVSKEELSKDFLTSTSQIKFKKFTDYYSSLHDTIEGAEKDLDKRMGSFWQRLF